MMVVRGSTSFGVVAVVIGVLAGVCDAATWNVSAGWQLDSAVATAAAGDEIVCAPGDYYPGHAYYITKAITIRGSTGNRDDVRIHGAGMNVDGGGLNNLVQFATGSSGFTIRDLTVQDVNQNGIQIHGENSITSGNIINVHTLNIGERHIKGSGRVVDKNILVQGCLMEQTIERSGYAASTMGYDYIGGIDTMGTTNWIVRNNVAKGIHGPTGGGRGAIFIWDGTNATVENNVIIGCDRGIAFGNPSQTYGPDHSIIRNNFIYRGADIAMELCYSNTVEVYNNTIYSTDANYSRTVHIYGTQTNLLSTNNLIRGQVFNNPGTWTSTNNIIGAAVDPSWFINALAGDLHLTPAATLAIGQGVVLAKVTTDIDGQPRGTSPDIGADQIILGDINQDGHVDTLDLIILADNWSKSTGDTGFNSLCDLNNDGRMDVVDLLILADHWGT